MDTKQNSLANSDAGIKRRHLLSGVAAGATLTALGAPAVHAQTRTIRFLNSEPGRDAVAVLKNAAAEYEKKTGVKVVVDTVPPDDAFSKLQASIASGNPYDIGSVLFAGQVVLLAQAGKLAPLTKLTSKYKWGPRIMFPIKEGLQNSRRMQPKSG